MNYFQIFIVSFISAIIISFLHHLFQNLNLYKSELKEVKLFFIIFVLSLPFTLIYNKILLDPYILASIYSFLLWLISSIIILPLKNKGFFGYKISNHFILSNLILHAVYGLILGILINL